MSSAGSGGANPKNDPPSASKSSKSTAKRDFQSTLLDFTGRTLATSSSSPTQVDDPKRRRTGDAPSPAQVAALDDADHAMEIDDGTASASRPQSAAVSSTTTRRRAHSPQAKKKMVIKPFKVKPQLAAAFEEDTQTKLTNAVEAVYQKAAVDMSQEELYRAVEALCIHNKAPQLYEKLVAQCEKHVAQLLQTLADELQPHQQSGGDTAMLDANNLIGSPSSAASHATLSVPFLQHVQSVWASHCDEMLIIRGIFLYLDRTYVIQLASASTVPHNNNDDHSNATACHQPPPKSLWDMGLGLFGAQLKKHPEVEQKVISGILALIERERNGESVNRSLLKSLLRMFTALKLYSVSFQPKFLETTGAFYSAESTRTIEASTPIEYIHYIQQRLQHEEDRAQAYLDETTRQPLMHLLQERLIRVHATHMLGTGFKQLLDQKRTVELGIMYKLFERIQALDQIRDSFGAYVKQTASDIVSSGSADPAEPAAASAAPAASSSSSASPAPSAAAGSSTPATMILDLLKLKMTLDELLTYSFSSNPDFTYALKQAFDYALNIVENKPAEMMAKFIDKVLRTGGKGIKITSAPTTTEAAGAFTGASGSASMLPGSTSASLAATAAPSSLSLASSAVGVGGSEEVESLLDQVMFLFRYIHGKDVFQAFYKKDLAKRLLLAKSASEDAEKSMISKIKSECGASFTTKLEGMFKDMDLSKETQKEYEKHREEALKAESAISSAASDPNAAQPMELTVQVLTTGSWPAYAPMDLTLPKEVLRMHEDFKAFYLNKHSGRKLIWHHPLATAILRAHFPKARKELAVSGMQAVVLMLFNEYTKLSMEDIGKFSGITDVMELKKTLASLTFSDDVKLLLKEPRNKKLAPTDVFSVNVDFAYKLFRIKVNTVQMKETKEEQKSTTTRVFEDRQYALDASIVRIMKARKTLSHQLLIMEVIQQSKFPTKPPDIKKRIASLIEREYMERDKENSSVYNYMA